MKRKWKRCISLVLSAISAGATALPMIACGGQPSNRETIPLTLSIDEPNGNFNPFFATSASDRTIVEQTQIRMLTTDASGKPVCGENEPTVALSYTENMKKGEETTTNANEATSTEYEFVIKNGVQFSDGTPLTIKDVLFNLYVYLDPMYTGSATISSVKIQGLNAYRWQDALASDDHDVNEGERYFYTQADARILNVLNYLSGEKSETDEIKADIAFIKKLFFEESESGGAENEDELDLQIQDVLTSEKTRGTLREALAMEIRSAYYDKFKETNEGLPVKTISGITTGTKTVDDEEHDVLKINVNGVDSKAIWNFAFPVAPMHYYAGETYAEKANGVDHFGVEYSNKEFFETVIQDPKKNALPMGAGAYQASNANGASTGVDGDGFYSGGWVYFTRNNHFNTVGSGLRNAKIKNLWYKVVPEDQILDSLINKEIHVGSPNAKPEHISQTDAYDYLESVTYTTNGYGYVGINPKAVPDIEVRRAIMKAMDTALVVRSYQPADLAEMIHRPLPIHSWAYPKVNDKNVGRHEKVQFSRSVDEICELVESAGYYRAEENSVYMKEGNPLKIVFTLVDETNDHPVYTMLTDAAEWLNENCGFDVTVTTDIQAASKLATGDLQVWAATRLLDVDPDLYSLYHKDSLDTNVKSLGYPTILANATGQFSYEKDIINQLSAKIDAGIATLNRTERKKIYAEALDLIMELCIELPVYQQKDLIVYNKKLIKGSTLNKKNASPTSGVFNRIWEIDYH